MQRAEKEEERQRVGARVGDEGRLEAPGQACQTGGSAGAQACR